MNRLVFLLFFAGMSLRFAPAEPIPARHKQGSMHGFLLLKSADGKVIGVGEVVQVAQRTRVRSRLVFHFRDGSVDEESTEFLEQGMLRLVSDHHVQKGPSFPMPLDVTISGATGQVSWQESKGGKSTLKTEHMQLPDDLANGMIPVVVENLSSNAAETKVSYLANDPKPRLVKLCFKPEEPGSFTVGWLRYSAARYNIHVELGGLTGVIAPFVGKQPADSHGWVIPGEVPTFAKIQGPLYDGGPVWTVELVSPEWSLSE